MRSTYCSAAVENRIGILVEEGNALTWARPTISTCRKTCVRNSTPEHFVAPASWPKDTPESVSARPVLTAPARIHGTITDRRPEVDGYSRSLRWRDPPAGRLRSQSSVELAADAPLRVRAGIRACRHSSRYSGGSTNGAVGSQGAGPAAQQRAPSPEDREEIRGVGDCDHDLSRSSGHQVGYVARLGLAGCGANPCSTSLKVPPPVPPAVSPAASREDSWR